jgi:predicted nucleic acid-binding protein
VKIAILVASYFDTSFLVKIYANEPYSDEAAFILASRSDMWISPFVEVEIACALHRLYVPESARNALTIFKSNLAQGDYLSLPIVPDIFLRAQSLAEHYSSQLKLRSLDAIHLATALHYNADELATYDTRLAQAATISGLTVVPARG